MKLLLTLALLLSATVAQAQNAIYDELTTEGLKLANGKTVKLPPPSMADGLDAAAQQKVVDELTTKGKVSKAEFLRKSVSSPYVLFINDTPGEPKQSIGRQFDLYFIAYGKLEDVADPKFMETQTKTGDGKRGSAEYFTAEELAERGLSIIDMPKIKERYAHATMPLFNLVEVKGVGHALQTQAEESVTVAFKLDPRFEKDATYPNQWRAIKKDDKGVPFFGPASPYVGTGAYMKVTELKPAADAAMPLPMVFVEYHLMYDEPYEWWDGAGVLRARLPAQFESDVRKFRRDLEDFAKKKAAAAGK